MNNFFKPYEFFQNLNEKEISFFLDKIKSLPLEKGMTRDDIILHKRSSFLKWIDFHDKNFSYFFPKLFQIVEIVNSSYFKFNLNFNIEPLQYTEYHESTSDHYDWHMDTFDEGESNRKLSIVIQLSEPNEYEGGDLEIYVPHPNPKESEVLTIPKEKGKVIIFPSYMWHRVTPVTKGIRKSLVWWVGGPHFK